MTFRRFLYAFLALAALADSGRAQEGMVPSEATLTDAAALAARIDEHLAARWQEEKVTPAPNADEAEFMRRVWLDIAGTIPPVGEARRYLGDGSPDRRQQLIEELLDSPAYVAHFTSVWRQAMLPEVTANRQLAGLAPPFEVWLRKKLVARATYDEIATELLTAALGEARDQASPVPFYQVKEGKPEEVAAATARVFLGVRLECAQCHDHPFAKWKRDQFWSFAAFFADVSMQGEGPFSQVQARAQPAKLMIPETDQTVDARFLNGEAPSLSGDQSPRAVLAAWIATAENPYFARAAVNRLWAQFFGIGIVDPVDDFDDSNPPSHPQLLDDLAAAFVASGYDVQFMIRAFTMTKAYQLTSRQTHDSQADPRLFARMAVKRMSPEQLFDSLVQATGYFEDNAERNPLALDLESPRARFSELFAAEGESSIEAQTSILQALALMNGTFIAEATGIEQSTTLAAVLDSPFLDDAGKVETLYLATLSREPHSHELAHMVDYVKSGGAAGDSKAALSDVFWALLNSSEFLLNH